MTALIGRDSELATLKQHLAAAVSGKGSTVLISGEPGIGKTALAEAFKEYASTQNAKILSGAAMSGSAHPFQVFSKALEGVTSEPLFEEQEYTSFTEIFAVNGAGLLLAKASSEEGGLDADIFAGMLSAVQDFVGDSFGRGGEGAALGRLEYGDMKILIEHGRHLYLTAVFSGNEHPDMKAALKQALGVIDEEHGPLLSNWTGKMSEMELVRQRVSKLAGARFLIRKNLEGVKLENERIRIADRVLRLLIGPSGGKATAIFLEDLHWADESSLFVFRYLARNMRGTDTLIIGTMRPGENPLMESTLAGMREEETLDEMQIGGLGEAGVKGIADSLCSPNKMPANFIRLIASRCGGNPFFVTQLLRQMMADGGISFSGTGYILVNENYTIPAGVEELARIRLESLEPGAISMAEYASCMGREFPLPALQSLGMVQNSLEAANALVESGIVTVSGERGEFVHALFQEVIYGSITGRWRSVYHRSVGEYLEEAYRENTEPVLYELAKHFSRSSENAKAFDYCNRAGDRAADVLAAELAIDFYESAMSLAQPLHISLGTEVELRRKLGEICAMCGNYERGIEVLNGAKTLAAEPSDIARIHRTMSELQEKRGDYDASLAEAEAGEALVGDSEPEKWRLQLNHAWSLIRKGEYEASEKLLNRVLDRFRESGMDVETASTLNMLGVIHVNRGDYDKGLENYYKSLEVYERLDDPYRVAKLHNNIGNVFGDRMESEKSLEHSMKALAAMEKLRDPQAMSFIYNNIGATYYSMGQRDLALEYFGKGLEIFERIGNFWGMAQLYINMGILRFTAGDIDSAEVFYKKSKDIRKRLSDKRGLAMSLSALGDVARHRKNYSEAEDLYRQSMEIAREIGARNVLPDSLLALANIMVMTGRAGESLPLIEESTTICAEGEMKDRLAESWLQHASALSYLGDLRKAEGLFESAEREFSDIDSEDGVANVKFEWGAALLRAGKPDEGCKKLRAAREIYKKQGMDEKRAECDRLLEENGTRG